MPLALATGLLMLPAASGTGAQPAPAAAAADPQLPDGWVDRPAMAARAAEAAAAAGLTVSVRAWGDATIGAFGIVAGGQVEGRMRTGDVLDGLTAQAGAAGIELRDPQVDGRNIGTGFARGRWQGRALVTAGDGEQGRGVQLAACFYTDRRPDRARTACAAFLAAFEPAEGAP